MGNTPGKSSRILSVIGFSILAAFSGVAGARLVVGILAAIFRHHREQLIPGSMPFLFAGGAQCFLIGLVVAGYVANAAHGTRQKIEKNYFDRSGRQQIYFGAHLFIVAACLPLAINRMYGTITYESAR